MGNEDLFGEVAVTQWHIDAWLCTVARLPHDSPRRAAYAAGWQVSRKVARCMVEDGCAELLAALSCPICKAKRPAL